jgi:ribonuclease H2 subunit C
VQINSLRGFPLKGIKMNLPENMQGVVLREIEKLQVDGSRELKFGGKFNKFTYWNYDKNPSENDAYKKAMHWIKVSEAVSSKYVVEVSMLIDNFTLFLVAF